VITEKLIFKIPYEFDPVESWADIFGANLFDWWDFNDATSMTLTGALIDNITSQVSSRPFAAGAGLRPTLITDATIGRDVADFDGVLTRMTLTSPATTSTYNFLHDGSGGCIIMISRNTLSGATQIPLSNAFGASERGFRMQFGTSDQVFSVVSNGSANVVVGASSNTFTVNKWNSVVQSIDADNATANDRVEQVLNGTSTKGNTFTGTPSTRNALRNLELGKAASATGAYFKGQISEIIIVNTIPTAGQLARLQTKIEADYGTFPI